MTILSTRLSKAEGVRHHRGPARDSAIGLALILAPLLCGAVAVWGMGS